MKLLSAQQLPDGQMVLVLEPGQCVTVGHMHSSLGAGLFLWPSQVPADQMFSGQAAEEVARMLRGMADQVEAYRRNPGNYSVTPGSLGDRQGEPT